MTQPTLSQLITARAIIRQQKLDLEMSDDLCHTNKKIEPFLQAEMNLTRQIKELEAR